MRRTLMLTLMVVISAVWLHAQAANAFWSAGQAASGPTTLQGCLQYTKGHYFLTDSSGTAHQLSNEANKLQKEVGKQIEVTGMPGVRTVDTTRQGLESSAKEEQVFKVKTVKQIADSCTPAGH